MTTNPIDHPLPAPMPWQRLLKPREAAPLLGVSTRTLERWRADQSIDLRYVRLPRGQIRYGEDDLWAFIAAAGTR